ncbi:MAG: ribosome biogenesis GTP-binding protein YihA/YsxC [candidate division Zixibacteria bacterium]
MMMARSTAFQAGFVGSFFDYAQLPKKRLPQVALAGRSNVGKSSLLNQMVGHKGLAKVSQTPGKTRSLNFYLVNEQFHMVDLPGYGYAKVALSVKSGFTKLMEEYLSKTELLAGLVLLLDCRRDPTPDDMSLLKQLSERKTPALLVATKTDKLNRDQLRRKVKAFEEQLGLSVLPFSVKSGVGKKDLVRVVTELVENSKIAKKA